MAPIIKSKEEREKIRETGRIVADVLAELRTAVHPGMLTSELDRIGAEALQRRGAKSSSLGYHGYPKSLCTSINDEVVHGIPGDRVLKEGDIVSIDFAASYNGWHADSAITVPVGTVSPEVQRLLKVTEDSLYRGIAARAFERAFQLADFVQVKDATLENGLLHVDLVREIPEASKPRQIKIANGAANGNGKAKQVEAKVAA